MAPGRLTGVFKSQVGGPLLHRYESHVRQAPFENCTLNMEIDIDKLQVAQPTGLFTRPLVVEVVSAGFDRPPNTRYFTLHFPRVVKIHHNRRIKDVPDFVEYQQLTDRSRAYATDRDNQVKEAWLIKLDYPTHDHRSTRETYSQDSISTARSVATDSHSILAFTLSNKQEQTDITRRERDHYTTDQEEGETK